MRRLLILAMFLLCVTPAHATWTEVQNVGNASCSASANTCAITVSSTTSGHVGVIIGITGSTLTGAITSISPGTWVIPAASQCSQSNATTGGTANCAYCLSLPGGQTTFTVTWNNASPGSFSTASFTEASTTLTAAFDVAGKKTTTTNTANQAGVTLTLSGSNDFIVQAMQISSAVSACRAPFATNAIFPGGNATCYAVNQSSGTPPSPTYTNTTGKSDQVAIALKEVSAGQACTLTLTGIGSC